MYSRLSLIVPFDSWLKRTRKLIRQQPSPPEKESFWRKSGMSRSSSNHRSLVDENEPFSISRESFDSYRRSFVSLSFCIPEDLNGNSCNISIGYLRAIAHNLLRRHALAHLPRLALLPHNFLVGTAIGRPTNTRVNGRGQLRGRRPQRRRLKAQEKGHFLPLRRLFERRWRNQAIITSRISPPRPEKDPSSAAQFGDEPHEIHCCFRGVRSA